MSRLPLSLRFVAFAVLLTPPLARGQGTPPAGATGICKDGTYTTAATKSGACRGHQGLKEWFVTTTTSPAASTSQGKSTAETTAPEKPPTTQTTPAVSSSPAASAGRTVSASTMSQAGAKTGDRTSSTKMAQAPGGGPGMVWLNTDSNVYHCPGGHFYGKTQKGSYMSESDAQAKGAHPDHNKPCSK